MTWASHRDGVPEWHVQHTVYEEATGDRVAIVFQSESNVALVTAAPALLAYGLEALRVLESNGLGDTFEARGLRRALDEATAAPESESWSPLDPEPAGWDGSSPLT